MHLALVDNDKAILKNIGKEILENNNIDKIFYYQHLFRNDTVLCAPNKWNDDRNIKTSKDMSFEKCN